MSEQSLALPSHSPSATLLDPDAFDRDGALSVRDWSAEMSRVYRAARRGRIDAARACRLVYVAAAGLKAASSLELNERLADLERKLVEQRQTEPASATFDYAAEQARLDAELAAEAQR